MDSQTPKLLADCMLGRLAKWLRLLGYDTTYYNAASDPALARRARVEGRTLLTRDHELSKRRGLDTLLIESQVLEEQIEQVQRQIPISPQAALSRCSICNVVLEPIAPEEAAAHVPPYILRTQETFQRCPACQRIYWAGTHIDEMRQQIDAFKG